MSARAADSQSLTFDKFVLILSGVPSGMNLMPAGSASHPRRRDATPVIL
jgi:hypothetical protein